MTKRRSFGGAFLFETYSLTTLEGAAAIDRRGFVPANRA